MNTVQYNDTLGIDKKKNLMSQLRKQDTISLTKGNWRYIKYFYTMYMTPLSSRMGTVLRNVDRVKCLPFLNLVTIANRH